MLTATHPLRFALLPYTFRRFPEGFPTDPRPATVQHPPKWEIRALRWLDFGRGDRIGSLLAGITRPPKGLISSVHALPGCALGAFGWVLH